MLWRTKQSMATWYKFHCLWFPELFFKHHRYLIKLHCTDLHNFHDDLDLPILGIHFTTGEAQAIAKLAITRTRARAVGILDAGVRCWKPHGHQHRQPGMVVPPEHVRISLACFESLYLYRPTCRFTDRLEMALFVLRYVSSLVIFILGLKAPGIFDERLDYSYFSNDRNARPRYCQGVSRVFVDDVLSWK